METALTPAIQLTARDGAATVMAEAFDDIMRQHQRRVYRVLLTLVRNPDEADTLTQECFLRAYQKLHTFRGESSIETWLLRIAVNLARDHAKNRRTAFWKRLLGLEDTNATGHRTAAVEFPQASPERSLLAYEELQAVWGAVEELSPQQRLVFTLRFVEDLPLAEIAQVLDLKIGSVKAQLSRATSAVRKRLKG